MMKMAHDACYKKDAFYMIVKADHTELTRGTTHNLDTSKHIEIPMLQKDYTPFLYRRGEKDTNFKFLSYSLNFLVINDLINEFSFQDFKNLSINDGF